MSDQTSKETLLRGIQGAEYMYTLMSLCTRQPYVMCDEETYDDEVYLFFDEKIAVNKIEELKKENIPVQVAKIEKKQLLAFLGSLYTMGINALVLENNEGKFIVQIEELAKRTPDVQGKKWIENPALHLTALTLAQELRRPVKEKNNEWISELQEELEANFKKGTFIVCIQKDEKGVPLVKAQNGDLQQPVFTDMFEFQKFNKGDKFRPLIVEADKLVQILANEAKGVMLNPLGVHLGLAVKKNNNQ